MLVLLARVHRLRALQALIVVQVWLLVQRVRLVIARQLLQLLHYQTHVLRVTFVQLRLLRVLHRAHVLPVTIAWLANRQVP